MLTAAELDKSWTWTEHSGIMVHSNTPVVFGDTVLVSTFGAMSASIILQHNCQWVRSSLNYGVSLDIKTHPHRCPFGLLLGWLLNDLTNLLLAHEIENRVRHPSSGLHLTCSPFQGLYEMEWAFNRSNVNPSTS